MARCYIDEATTRRITGWAVGDRLDRPCRLRLEVAGQVVGHAIARRFRRDLLDAGIGHGHHGFAARLVAALPPGAARVRVFDADGGEIGAGTGGSPITIVPAAPAVPLSVEELLEQVDHWLPEDVARHASVLRLAANMAAMGVSRFVDVSCDYVLGRWAEAAMQDTTIQDGAQALACGTLSAEDFVRALLRSDARRAVHVPLATPYEPRFPYDID
jgi:hypothetical protein